MDPYLKNTDEFLRAIATMVLSSIITEKENSLLEDAGKQQNASMAYDQTTELWNTGGCGIDASMDTFDGAWRLVIFSKYQ